jgi:hypothetical protein
MRLTPLKDFQGSLILFFSAHRGCVKKPEAFIWRLTPPNNSFKKTLFSLILRSKINENSVFLKLSFAAVGGGILVAQPRCAEKYSLSAQAAKGLVRRPQMLYTPEKIISGGAVTKNYFS